MLRRLVNQRLTAAAQEICGLLEGTMSEYEEELCSLKEENERHRRLLDAVFNPEVRLQRADTQNTDGHGEAAAAETLFAADEMKIDAKRRRIMKELGCVRI
ncbi:hypothetical protein EYF80_051019 [Liparis tanakae]|uniref:Uncharacterized protein n=1 Tax=Liparis tanakae TaxID=230148 RepID=A0A4Z2FEH5_9TELE|nr:hypothetical protein EYF80_051019 [Liparis tanakae]